MAGRPKVRVDLAKLTTLTIEDANSIFERIATEEHLYRIAESFGVGLTALTEWINATPERIERFKRARVSKATYLAESAMEIADQSAADAAAKDKLRVGTRRWLASVYDRETYGEQKGAQVTINLATLHLDALRRKPSITIDAQPDRTTLDAPNSDA